MKYYYAVLIASALSQVVGAHEVAISRVPMKSEELKAVFSEFGEVKRNDIWSLTGDEVWSSEPHCLIERNVYVLSLPKKYDQLVRASAIKYSFTSTDEDKDDTSPCGKLSKPVKEIISTVKFSNTAEVIPANGNEAEVAKYFYVQRSIGNKQLRALKKTLDDTSDCVLHKKSCDTIAVSIRLPDNSTELESVVGSNNIYSVEMRPSADKHSPLIVSFKTAPELLVYVYGAGTKYQRVEIEQPIP